MMVPLKIQLLLHARVIVGNFFPNTGRTSIHKLQEITGLDIMKAEHTTAGFMVDEEVLRKIEMIAGPHFRTIIKMYEAKNYA